MQDSSAVATLMERIDELATLSEEADLLVRRSFTPQAREANDLVAGWMRAAGMAVREDAIGNLVGRYDSTAARPRMLILGSHLDSVRDAGKYDGPLGVLAALACVERIHAEGLDLPFALEVVAFTDEEGLRFHSYLGSSAVAGTFNPAWFDQQDDDGVTLAEAIRGFGGDPGAVRQCRRDPGEVIGYCEVHIEQGPILEAEDLPIGVVDAIAGQDRVSIELTGASGHAGTVPMARRRDAVCAAAEIVLAAERAGRDGHGLMATVGQIVVSPGASNVIPGRVSLSLDVRHPDDRARIEAVAALRAEADAVAARRGVALKWTSAQCGPAVPCSPHLTANLARAIEDGGYRVRHLTSGAGHDAVPMASLTDVAMLFVRCRGGISHNPAESVRECDVEVALETLYRFVVGLATEAAIRVSPGKQ